MKKSRKSLLLSDILMLVCVCLLLYPIVSDIWNEAHSSQMYGQYQESVASMSDEEIESILNDAREYNESLVGRSNSRFTMTDAERSWYESLLHVGNDDVMAYVSCEKIGVENMPVYHGTSSEVLQVGVGHYEGSSLPVGGKGTHTVLSGHTGMAGLKMFSELSKLEIGDTFQVKVLNQVLTYEVDDINQVYPNDISHLGIDENEDYCTLVTCIPIGINSQRLLVRGHRVATMDTSEVATDDGVVNPVAQAWQWLTNRFATYELVMTATAILILTVFIVPDGIKWIRRKARA